MAKHERATKCSSLIAEKQSVEQKFAAECNRLLTGFSG